MLKSFIVFIFFIFLAIVYVDLIDTCKKIDNTIQQAVKIECLQDDKNQTKTVWIKTRK